MSQSLETSYAHCRQTARRAASNFFYSFYVLPKAQRRSMCALYAFLRKTDDLADDDRPIERRREMLVAWRESFQQALNDRCDDPIFPALIDAIRRHRIPVSYLSDVIDGVERDLQPAPFETFDDLAGYCHLVASSVGLACIHIWGFHGPAPIELARHCGLAFQLTNILRDLGEDARRDRVYLPLEDLRRFELSPDELKSRPVDERFDRLFQFEIARAREHYRAAETLPACLQPSGRRMLAAMNATYRELLNRVERAGRNALDRPTRIGRLRRMAIAVRSLFASSAPVERRSKAPT